MEQGVVSVSKMSITSERKGLLAGVLLLNSGEVMGFLLVCFALKLSKSCVSHFQKKDLFTPGFLCFKYLNWQT